MAFLQVAIGSLAVLAGDVDSHAGESNLVAGIQHEGGEADNMVVDLFDDNQRLKKKNAELQAEVENLQRLLAQERIKADLQTASADQTAVPDERRLADTSPVDANQLKVLEVNKDMMVAVVSGGFRAGMKVGMKFSVVRDDETVAIIRLIDIRDSVAGGLIEKSDDGRFPHEGDRLVLRKTQD